MDDFILLAMLDPVSVEHVSLTTVLDKNGVKYITRDRTVTSGRNIQSRIEILVPFSHYEKAKSLLKEVDAEIAKGKPTFCPKCDCEIILERTRLVFLGLFQRNVYRCSDCGYEWKPGL